MADTVTANYNWTKPEVGGSGNTWGNKLNSDLDSIDAKVASMDPEKIANKTSLADADGIQIRDSAALNIGKYALWSLVKSTLKAYFDPLYASIGRQVIAGTGLTGGGTLSADRTFDVAYGTAAGTAAQGNDSRIVGALQKAGGDMTGALTVLAPSAPMHPATKAYVDALPEPPAPNYATGNAALSRGGVGTYSLFKKTASGTLAAGATISGANLQYAAVVSAGGTNNSGSPSGTWRNMGMDLAIGDSTVFLRIS